MFYTPCRTSRHHAGAINGRFPDAYARARGVGEPAVRNLFCPPPAKRLRAVCRLVCRAGTRGMADADRKTDHSPRGVGPAPHLEKIGKAACRERGES